MQLLQRKKAAALEARLKNPDRGRRPHQEPATYLRAKPPEKKVQEPAPSGGPKERLIMLNELRDAGLVTEAEYAEKRNGQRHSQWSLTYDVLMAPAR